MSVVSDQFMSIVSFRRMDNDSVRKTLMSCKEDAVDVFVSIRLDQSEKSFGSVRKSKIKDEKHCLMCNIM